MEVPISSILRNLFSFSLSLPYTYFQNLFNKLSPLIIQPSDSIHQINISIDYRGYDSPTQADRPMIDMASVQDDRAKETTQSWRDEGGSRLKILLEEAGYPPQYRDKALNFFAEHVAPSLGTAPTTSCPIWKSPMTDDFSPIEYSWTWASNPQVRYSVEMIGHSAGSSADPFNEDETLAVVERLKICEPHMDWELFELFFSRTKVGGKGAESGVGSSISMPGKSDPASLFLAFEPLKGQTTAKAYFIPPNSMFEDSLSLFRDLIRTLHTAGLASDAHNIFLDFLTPGPSKPLVTCLWVAVDCVKPSQSRLKFYVRSKSTSFDTVLQVLRLNGMTDTTWTDPTVVELKKLWRLVLDLPEDFSQSDQLQQSRHETSGILYYFDIHPKYSVPLSKVYIPVKHYGRNDQAVLDGLVEYLDDVGDGRLTSNFKSAVKGLSPHRSLDSRCGIQTYISCAAKEGKLSLTSYLSPELYRRYQD